MCYISEAKAAVERLHRCNAIHVETIPINGRQTLLKQWVGDVEVFALEGCAEADCCFVWSYRNDTENGKREFVSVPAIPPIVTPSKAVLAVVEWEAKMASQELR